jgi:raffinose/stachyose/melibiose transport system substrate-binding protein
MKRQVAILCLIGMLSMLGMGCQPAGGTTDGQTDDQATAPSTAQPIVRVHILQNKVEVADVFRQISYAYTRENPTVQIEIETLGAGMDYFSSLLLRFESGAAPDIFTNDGYALFDSCLLNPGLMTWSMAPGIR